MENFIAPDEEHHGNGHRADRIHQGRTDGLNAHAAQVGAKEPLGSLLEAQDLPQLGVEGLYDAVAGNGFMQNILDFGQLVLAGASARAHLAANLARGGDHDGNEEQKRPAELPAKADDKDQSHDKGEKLLQKLADDRAERNLHAVYVVDERREDGAGGMAVEKSR